MGGAVVIAWLLVLLCGGAGSYCTARLCLRRAAPPAHRAADATEAVMGLGMAVMAAGLTTPTGLGVAVYGSAALVSLVLGALAAGHRAHHAYHVVGHGAMVYMTVTMAAEPQGMAGTPGLGDLAGTTGMAGMTGMPTRGIPLVTGTLLLACVGVSVAAGRRLIAPPGPMSPGPVSPGPVLAGPAPPGPMPGGTPPGGRPLWRAPALAEACQVVMGLSMATMLALM